jgi:hypothetical protein
MNDKQLQEAAEKYGIWVSVDDRLPEDNKVMLTYSQNNRVKKMSFGWYNYHYKCWFYYAQKKRSVTHWMPLPEPPTK